MIKIKNTSNKIIHINKTQVMPGEELEVNAQVAETPAIKLLEKRKAVSITRCAEVTADDVTETTAGAAATVDTTEIATETVTADDAAETTKKKRSMAKKSADEATTE